MPSLDLMMQWAINTARAAPGRVPAYPNVPPFGSDWNKYSAYAQSYRNQNRYRQSGPAANANGSTHYNGVTYTAVGYDCASFVFFAVGAGGWNVYTTAVQFPDGSYNAWVVSNMGPALQTLGWQHMPYSEAYPLRPGDIVESLGHTEIYIGNDTLVGAHNSHKELPDQVSETGYYDGDWLYVDRWGSSPPDPPNPPVPPIPSHPMPYIYYLKNEKFYRRR